MPMRFLSLALMCAVLSGCSLFKQEPEIPDFGQVAISTPPPALPRECLRKGDPKWEPLPPKGVEVKTSDVKRRDDRNQTRFEMLESKRAICEAAITKAGQ